MSRPALFIPSIDWSGGFDSENVVVWLPAFGDSGTMTARPYVKNLNQLGWSVMVTNHHRAGFCMNDSVAKVLAQLTQAPRKRILMVGASFGAQIMAEVLRRAAPGPGPFYNRLGGRFSVIPVCGMTSGQDSIRSIELVKKFHGPVAGTLFKLGQAWDITTGIRSPYDEDKSDVVASIKPHRRFRKWHFTGRALIEQLYAMATTPPMYPGEFPEIPALILSTSGEDVVLKALATERMARAFPRNWQESVDLSIHCDLTELPSQYGPKIWDFAEMIIETRPRVS